MEELQQRIKMSDGFGLFCRRWPAKVSAGNVVLCLHGIEAHSGAFAFMGHELSDAGSDVYAFDRRGFGNSKEESLPRGDTKNFERHLADLGEMVEMVRRDHPGKKTILFGHSIGTAYALWYAANYPGILDGVVLAAPPVEPGFKVPARDVIKFPFLKLFKPHAMYDLLEQWPLAFKKSEESKLLTEDELCTKVFGVGWLLGVQTKLANKMLKNAAKIGIPTLVIQGDADIIALPGGSKKLIGRLMAKDKSLRTFADADHWFYHTIIPKATSKFGLDKQREVSSVLIDWVKVH